MPTALVSSSTSGFSEGSGTTVTTPVPAGTAAGQIALLDLELWASGGVPVTVTWPAGFTECVNVVNGSQKLVAAWKRLTGADTGDYVATLSVSHSNQGHCSLISGAVASGNPIEATNTAIGSGVTAVPSTSVTTATQPFLAHMTASANAQPAATATPPTGYTLVFQGADLVTSYRIPGATGSHTASGGTLSVSSVLAVALVAIMPAAAPVVVSGTLDGTLPALTGNLTTSAKATATLTGTLGALTGSVTGSIGAGSKVTGSLTGTLPTLTGTATAAAKVAATAAGTLPALTGQANATARVSATMPAVLPGLTATLTGNVATGIAAVDLNVTIGLTRAGVGVGVTRAGIAAGATRRDRGV